MQLRIQAIFYNNPDLYPPVINGTRLLVSSGFSVDVLCREYGERWSISYPPTARIRRIASVANTTWRQYLEFVIRVLQSADRSASLYLGHDMHGLLPARLLATLYRKPLVYHCHDFAGNDQSLPPGSRVARFLEHLFARTADLVIVPDAERGEVMSKELRLKCAPLVVANTPLLQGRATGQVLHAALARQGRRFERVVLRQGRIGPGHAIEATLYSIPQWARCEWGFVVMGIGEAAYLESLMKLARELGIETQFAILPPVSYDRVLEFTPGADVGHALYEPIHLNNMYITTASNKAMEYMATGLPLLVSDRPALRAFVEKYGCGLAVDEDAPEAIATAVNALLGDPDLAVRMGAAGAKAFEEEFHYEHQFAPVLGSFRSLGRATGVQAA